MSSHLRAAVLLLLSAAGAMPAPPGCRAADINDFQTWWDITTIYEFNDRWRYDGDQGTRGIVSNEDWTFIYVRPSVRYKARPWFAAHGGIGFGYTDFDFSEHRFEIRPWLGARFYWPNPGGYVFSHYFRVEDRFIYSRTEDAWDAAFRVRYRLGVKTPDFHIAGAGGFYGAAAIELFKDMSEPVFERIANRARVDVGIGKPLGNSWRIEPHYIYQTSRLLLRQDIQIDEHVLRLRLFYRFN